MRSKKKHQRSNLSKFRINFRNGRFEIPGADAADLRSKLITGILQNIIKTIGSMGIHDLFNFFYFPYEEYFKNFQLFVFFHRLLRHF